MQQVMQEPAGRIAPAGELVNTFEFEAMAQRRVGSETFALMAGGNERGAFGRITFRPRMMVNTTGLDLTASLFGRTMFAPIIVGPLGGLKRFHPEGVMELARGAAAAKAAMVISEGSDAPGFRSPGSSGFTVSNVGLATKPPPPPPRPRPGPAAPGTAPPGAAGG